MSTCRMLCQQRSYDERHGEKKPDADTGYLSWVQERGITGVAIVPCNAGGQKKGKLTFCE